MKKVLTIIFVSAISLTALVSLYLGYTASKRSLIITRYLNACIERNVCPTVELLSKMSVQVQE